MFNLSSKDSDEMNSFLCSVASIKQSISHHTQDGPSLLPIFSFSNAGNWIWLAKTLCCKEKENGESLIFNNKHEC